MSEPQETKKPNRFRITSIIIAIVMLASAFGAFIGPFTINVSAVPDTHPWDGGGANALASTIENWVGDAAAPEAGDTVVFDAGALPCTWDLAITLASFSMNAGYSGVVTNAAATNWGTSGTITVAAGTLATVQSSIITCGGDLIYSGGLIINSNLKLIMTGTGKTFSAYTVFHGYSLEVTGTIATSGSFMDWGSGILVVGASGVLTLGTSGLGISVGTGYSNLGIIDGTGTFVIGVFYNADQTITLGTINCPLQISSADDQTGNRVMTLGANAVLGSTLTVVSLHTTRTMTLDLSTSNYALSATSITIGTRGIIKGRGSTITCAGNWDSSVGAFTRDTSTVIMSGTTKTLKANAVQGPGFQNLTIAGGATITLLSNVYVDIYFIETGTLTRGIYSVIQLQIWSQTSGNLASTDGNWVDGTKPIAGQGILFDGTSVMNCTWDIAATFTSFYMLPLYTGTVTYTVTFGVSAFYIYSGTFAGSGYHFLEDSGDFIVSGGNITGDTIHLNMTGTGGTIRSYGAIGLLTLHIMGDTIVDVYALTININDFIIDSDTTLSINKAKTVQLYGSPTYSNAGTITGLGKLFFYFSSNRTFALGTVICDQIYFVARSNSIADDTFTLAEDYVTTSDILVYSEHAVYTMTLDLNNHNLSSKGIFIGTRGVLNADNSSMAVAGNWDTSMGTFIAGNSSVTMSQSIRPLTIKIGGPQAFYDLTISSDVVHTSQLTVSHNLVVEVGQTLKSSYGYVMKYSSNPVIVNVTANYIGDPGLIYANGYYYMAYAYLLASTGDWVIAMSKSSDFLSWTELGIIITGSELWESEEMGSPYLYYEAGTYYLFYQGGDDAFDRVFDIGVATNTNIDNPIGWVQYPGNPILVHNSTEQSIYDSSVLKVGNTYYLFYICYGGLSRGISLATSTDMYSWTRYGDEHILESLYITNAGIEASNVYQMEPGSYIAYMTITDPTTPTITAIAESFSYDLIHWSDVNARASPLIRFSQSWEIGGGAYGVSSPAMLLIGDTMMIAYTGYNTASGFLSRIGVATASTYSLNLTSLSTATWEFATGSLSLHVSTGDCSFLINSWKTGGTIAKWSINSSDPNTVMVFTLSGLESGRMYRVYIDGVSSNLLTASGGGVISFTYSGPWSEHQFEIVGTSITGSISPLVNLIFIMFAIGVVVGVIAEGTYSIRKNKMLSTPEMMRMLFNMLIYIVIGIAGIGVLYSIVV